MQPSVHSSPPTRASVPDVSMAPLLHAPAPPSRLRRPWLPTGKLVAHVDHTGGNRRFGHHGRGHRRGGGRDRARGRAAQPEHGGRRRHGGGPRPARWPSRSRRASAPRRRRPAISGRVRATTHLGELVDVDLVIESVVEDLGGEEGPLRRARQHLQARHDPGHQHLDAAGGRDGDGDRAARPGVRHPLLQPGARHGPRRGRAAHHGQRRHRGGGASPSPPPAARTPSRSRTRPASSSTRCCSPTSTTRCACSSRAWPPRRASTPP